MKKDIKSSTSERNTWNKQEAEARAYLLDNNADVPFIRTLAESRGVPLDYLANKIIERKAIAKERERQYKKFVETNNKIKSKSFLSKCILFIQIGVLIFTNKTIDLNKLVKDN